MVKPDSAAYTEIRVLGALADIDRVEWDALNHQDNPFLSYDFLNQLELHHCLDNQGWLPCHHLLYRDQHLVAAMPLYIKHDSYGEFVFDWAWADAYQRAGRAYYPKLVSAIPFSPVLGERILLHPQHGIAADSKCLFQKVIDFANEEGMSSGHILFCQQSLPELVANEDALLQRHTWQYHWFNRDYQSFDDFLSALNSKRRKQIRKERRELGNHDLSFEILTGEDIQPRHWEYFYQFYCATFERKWGEPRFTLAFFQSLSETLADKVVLFMVKHRQRYIAGAFALRSADTLYGRHWGCLQHLPYLHFECCYYQTIEYCIAQGLRRLDAGIQGEHKIFRGFEPVKACSYHWIEDPGFRRGVAAFLQHETRQVDQQIELLKRHIPYTLKQ